jgi:hypothetical protein
LSNLRQIGQAAIMYANEHRGYLPPSAALEGHLIRFKKWATAGREWVTRDAMAKYVKGNVKVFYCPSNQLPKRKNGGGVNDIFSLPPQPSDYYDTSDATVTGWLGYWWVTACFQEGNLPAGLTQDQMAINTFYVRDDQGKWGTAYWIYHLEMPAGHRIPPQAR